MAAILSQIYFRFLVLWRLAFRKAICIPNFDQISQSTAEILLLPVAENKRPPYLNSTFVFDLTSSPSSVRDSAPAYQILYEIDLRRSNDVICILQDGDHSVTNLLPVSGLATSKIWECLKLSAYQILTKCLNPRPRYYYFRFLKTNGRHIEILFSVSILTFSMSSACDSTPAYYYYANWIIVDGIVTSCWFYKMAAIASHIYFGFLVWSRLTYKNI